eukprot:UN11859
MKLIHGHIERVYLLHVSESLQELRSCIKKAKVTKLQTNIALNFQKTMVVRFWKKHAEAREIERRNSILISTQQSSALLHDSFYLFND